ncbi:MAG: hypothetical protein O3B22_18385 [Proteobacteria bacterium]|jgi:hypothetical protein|nr:hypothetical protein [Pseudomonadota bacterium]
MSRSFANRLDRVEAARPDTAADPLRIVRVIIDSDAQPVEAYERRMGADGSHVLQRMTPKEFADFEAIHAA